LRWLGGLLILTAGYLSGNVILRPQREHIELLVQGSFLFRLLESGMCYHMIPLPELLGQMEIRSASPWRDFFREVRISLCAGPDEGFSRIFERVLRKHMGRMLAPEEMEMFLQLGEGIITQDLQFHSENSQRILSAIEKRTDMLREQLRQRSKAVRVSCMAVSILIIIILI